MIVGKGAGVDPVDNVERDAGSCDVRAHPFRERRVAAVESDYQREAALVADEPELGELVGGHGRRLLYEHRLADPERLDREPGVAVVPSGDRNEPDTRI